MEGEQIPGELPVMRRPMRIDISVKAIIRVLAALVVVWLWLRLWQWVLLLVVATFLAVGLDPLVSWLDARRVRRRFAAPLVVLTITALLVGLFVVGGSSLSDQAQVLGSRLDEVQREVIRRTPPRLLAMLPQGEGGQGVGTYLVTFGRSLINGLVSLGIALVLTVYLLVDGRRTFEWLVAFAPADQRPRVRQTAAEGRRAVLAYMRGNAVTSVLAGVCAYVAMRVLGIPAALLLAVLTAIFDLLPVIGIFLSAVPAILLGLSVSASAALGIAVFHAAYNLVENYYITPKIYGRELRLSDLAVVLGLAVGAELAGVVGALVFLPIVAMYPAVERIWLRDHVPPDTVQAHRRLEDSEEH
jgi:predicted PurR-regulated permease PerM